MSSVEKPNDGMKTSHVSRRHWTSHGGGGRGCAISKTLRIKSPHGEEAVSFVHAKLLEVTYAFAYLLLWVTTTRPQVQRDNANARGHRAYDKVGSEVSPRFSQARVV